MKKEDNMKTGIELITDERKRQIEEEGWSATHDDEHFQEELARAAAVYATPLDNRNRYLWPWDRRWYKPSVGNRVRELVKAGALIAAEIDRLQRIPTYKNKRD